MKRIFSFVLAAMLMFGLFLNIIPAAHADEITSVNVNIYDEDGNEIWTSTAPKGEVIVDWLDANATAHIAKTGFTADKWYSKDSGSKFDDSATFNGWTNVMVKYQAEVVEDSGDEEPIDETPDEVPVRIFDGDGNEIWGGLAPEGDKIVDWLDAHAADIVSKPGFTADKWYNKDSGSKFDNSATFNGWTNVVVKYESNAPEPSSSDMYVDVILNEKTSDFTTDDYHHCILEDGKVKKSDIDSIAAKIKDKGIVGWTYDFQGTKVQSDSLSKFDFSFLIAPINVYPVFEKTPEQPVSNKFPYKAYLHIFFDNKVDEPAKTLNITDGIAIDGGVTLSEVKSLVKTYYTALTSDGIMYDGLYLAHDNWVSDFVNNNKSDSLDIKEDLQKGYVHINVVISNAKLIKSNDKINDIPKTGDNRPVFAVAVVGVVAAIGLIVALPLRRRQFKFMPIISKKR